MTLFRYFSREVFLTMLTVAGVVLVISVGWRFGGYLEEAAAGLMTSEILFTLMWYRLPGFLELIMPVSFFLAIMLVYGRFHVDQEMVILQSCGMSPGRLAGMTLGMAAVVMALTASISLWLRPLGEQQVESLLEGQGNLTEFDTLVPGRFQALSSGRRVTYTEKISEDDHLGRVFINEYESLDRDQSASSVTVIAESGETQVDDLGRRFLVLRDGTRYEGEPGSRDYQVITYEEYGQLVEREDAAVKKRRRSALPTAELWGNDSGMAVSELQWRLSIVLMIPIVALLAIPLAKVNPRQGRFTKMVPGMVICFLYIILLSSVRSGLEKETVSRQLGMWWVHGAFILLTLGVYQFDRVLEFFNRIPSRRPR